MAGMELTRKGQEGTREDNLPGSTQVIEEGNCSSPEKAEDRHWQISASLIHTQSSVRVRDVGARRLTPDTQGRFVRKEGWE